MLQARSLLKLILFLLMCGIGIPLQMIVITFTRGRTALFLPWLFQYLAARLYGLSVDIRGTPLSSDVLFVGNHLSYLDIIAMGQCFPVSFIAKKEVSGWPIFGLLAKLQRTVFIERRRTQSHKGKDALSARLSEGLPLILFGEGTSTNGTSILPFKSTLFEALFVNNLKNTMRIQAFTLTLETIDGRPVKTNEDRDLYAWHGDMTLPPHLWKFGQLRGASLRLTFHPPRTLRDYEDRKILAIDCYNDCRTEFNAPPEALASPAKSL